MYFNSVALFSFVGLLSASLVSGHPTTTKTHTTAKVHSTTKVHTTTKAAATATKPAQLLLNPSFEIESGKDSSAAADWSIDGFPNALRKIDSTAEAGHALM